MCEVEERRLLRIDAIGHRHHGALIDDDMACVSCHGSNFAKPIDPTYPKIAGQLPDYLFAALKSYKTEGNPGVGRSNGVMGAIAKQFSNAELKVLAKYVASLDGELQTVPEPKLHH